MVREFSKPLAARRVEARARARALAVKVAVVVPGREYTTRSRATGEPYTIRRTPAGWACACRGYYETGCCKHLGGLERRAAREGWAFGSIAPLARVARYFPLTEPDPDPEPTPPAGAGALPDPDPYPDELAVTSSPQWDGGRREYEARAYLARQRAAALADLYSAD